MSYSLIESEIRYISQVWDSLRNTAHAAAMGCAGFYASSWHMDNYPEHLCF